MILTVGPALKLGGGKLEVAVAVDWGSIRDFQHDSRKVPILFEKFPKTSMGSRQPYGRQLFGFVSQTNTSLTACKLWSTSAIKGKVFFIIAAYF